MGIERGEAIMFIEKYCSICGYEITYKGWIGTFYDGKKFCECEIWSDKK